MVLDRSINTPIIHGPCLTTETNDFDFAFCLHSKSWVTSAQNWITRSNYLWPSYDVKHSIVKHSVLFVPVGFKNSPVEEIEWRISFSVGEKLLIYSFTHTQLVCYCLMKIILKDVINVCLTKEYRELLCSYFLKTVLFWISEELHPSIWKAECLLPCFMRCFRRLIYYVEYSTCPHYFIPQNNLFENKIEGYARQILLKNLLTLESYGWQCILFSNVFRIPVFKIQDRSYMYLSLSDILKFKNSKVTVANASAAESRGSAYSTLSQTDTIGMQQILSYKRPRIKYAYKYYMSKICTQKAQLVPMTSVTRNKLFYMNYKASHSFILQSFYHDNVSGWLMLASLFYRTNQYHQAIYVLAKNVYFKLYPTSEMIITYLQLHSVKSFQKNFVPLYKIVHSDSLPFHSKSTLIPLELQMEVEKLPLHLPATTYTHFLRFLCEYHLNHFKECRESLRNLQMTITNYDGLPGLKSKALSFICLGIVFQLYGDKDSAWKSFQQAFELDTPVKETALKRLMWLKHL